MSDVDVEVPRVVTETETVTICDDCGREVGPGGAHAVPCDFCVDCRDYYTDPLPTPEVLTREQYTEQAGRGGNFTPRTNLRLTLLASMASLVMFIAAALITENPVLVIGAYLQVIVFVTMVAFRAQYINSVEENREAQGEYEFPVPDDDPRADADTWNGVFDGFYDVDDDRAARIGHIPKRAQTEVADDE